RPAILPLEPEKTPTFTSLIATTWESLIRARTTSIRKSREHWDPAYFLCPHISTTPFITEPQGTISRLLQSAMPSLRALLVRKPETFSPIRAQPPVSRPMEQVMQFFGP